ILHSEDKAEDFAGLFDEKGEADRIEEFETKIKNRVDEAVPVRVSAAISFVGDTSIVQGIFSNISDKMQSQEKLSTTNEYLQSLLDSIQAAILVIDAESRLIVDINPVVSEMLGLPREQIIGQECNTLICSEDKADCLLSEDGICAERLEQVITDSRGREIPVLRTSAVKKISGQKFFIVSFIDISERKKLEERLHQLSITDELTNILNRRGFITLAEQQLKVADRRKNPFYLLYADVNNMKLINDTHGHSSGDEALKQVAMALKMFRESDIVGRLGGDEFAALFSGESGELTKELITKRFNENLQIVSKQRDRKFKLTISVGIIRYDPLNPCSLPDLLSRADQLMYKHKLKRT
ncbi:MAG: diguanylate cyclase, partial [Thermodesulfobacteriota bacterium]|nr:diguanylate cyclase [Thermodesulfobacteriota bacterium]